MIYNYKDLQTRFAAANDGTNRRKNKFVFEQMRYPKFRSFIRNYCYYSGMKERWMDFSDDEMFAEIIKGFQNAQSFCGDFVLGIEGFYNFRVSNSPDAKKRENYIAYSREGHTAVRERAAKLLLKSIVAGVYYVAPKVANKMAGDFAERWCAYIKGRDVAYTLHVDDNVERIYDSNYCLGSFHSCMTDAGYTKMYQGVAKAAYITNGKGLIVARALYWENVLDIEGNIYRYLDRPYSTDSSASLQELLIDKMKAAELIDLYKPAGTACGDAERIYGLDDNLFSKSLYVPIDINPALKTGVCPYMDTFKYSDGQSEKLWTDIKQVSSADVWVLEKITGDAYSKVYSQYLDIIIDEDDAVFCEDIQDYADINGEDAIFCTYDTCEYFYKDYDLYWADDIEEYFKYEDELCYAEDTCEYYYYEEKLCRVLTADGREFYYKNDDGLVWSDAQDHWLLENEAVYMEDTEDYDFQNNKN